VDVTASPSSLIWPQEKDFISFILILIFLVILNLIVILLLLLLISSSSPSISPSSVVLLAPGFVNAASHLR